MLLRHRIIILYVVTIFCALAVGTLPVCAEDTTPDKALLATAQQAGAAGKWNEVAETIESLRKQHPNSPVLADGMLLLYQAYLEQNLSEKSASVGKEIVAKWPRSSYVWQVVLITCKQKAKTSAADAIASLDVALQQNMLSASDKLKAQKLRFTYLEQSKSDQYFTEALAKINGLKPPFSQNELLDAAGLARGLYTKLMAQGRFEDAKAISGKIEDLLIKAGNPQGAMQADQRAYLNALQAADNKRFLDEALPAIRMVELADTDTEARVSIELLAPLYLTLFKEKPVDEIRALHGVASKTLKRLNNSELLKYEECAWMDALMINKPELYLAAMKEKVAAMKEAKSADDVVFRASSGTIDIYLAAFKARQADDAKALHMQIQDFFKRFAMTKESVADQAQYDCAHLRYLRETDKKQYLTDVTTVLVQIADQSTNLDQIRPALSTAVYYGPYSDLFEVGRTDDAKSIFDHIQAGITRIDQHDGASLNLNQQAYLWAFSRYDPENFLKVFLPMVAKTETGCSANEAKFLAGMAQPAYGALLEMGQTDDARKTHARLQNALKKFPELAATGETEVKGYLTALAEAAPQEFMVEIQPVLEKLAKAQTAEEALQYAPIVQQAYEPLNRNGSFLEARTAHDQLQMLFKKFNRTAEADEDSRKYRDTMSVQSLEAMLQLFKKAMVAKDGVTAKKWLDELNTIAPDAPQAARARAIFKEANGNGK